MTPKQKKRLGFVLSIIGGLALATFFGIKAIEQNANYFVQPSDIAKGGLDLSKGYRIGGIVKPDSVKRSGVEVAFKITDCDHDVVVNYEGILPDLFREGQGIVANGKLSEDNNQLVFMADQVLAKHDENYVPTELANEMLERQKNQCDPVS